MIIIIAEKVGHRNIKTRWCLQLYQGYLETLKHVRKETKKSTTENDINPPITQRVAKH